MKRMITIAVRKNILEKSRKLKKDAKYSFAPSCNKTKWSKAIRMTDKSHACFGAKTFASSAASHRFANVTFFSSEHSS